MRPIMIISLVLKGHRVDVHRMTAGMEGDVG